ncbi:MAG: hypothetical protein WCO12_03905 [bacterium]
MKNSNRRTFNFQILADQFQRNPEVSRMLFLEKLVSKNKFPSEKDLEKLCIIATRFDEPITALKLLIEAHRNSNTILLTDLVTGTVSNTFMREQISCRRIRDENGKSSPVHILKAVLSGSI